MNARELESVRSADEVESEGYSRGVWPADKETEPLARNFIYLFADGIYRPRGDLHVVMERWVS